MSESFSWGQDLTILFIGGNDFPSNSREEVTSDLLQLIKEFQDLGSRVVVFQIESRKYIGPNRFGVTTESYKEFQTYVNNRLRKVANKRKFRTIHMTRNIFETNRRDGIHFNSVGQEYIVDKIYQSIHHHMNSN